jgi:hypothetical protein
MIIHKASLGKTISNWNMFNPFPSKEAWEGVFSDLCLLHVFEKFNIVFIFASHFFSIEF